MSRNSKVILAKNIKLDKNYKSVLKITESDMVSLMTNSSNLVYQNNSFEFLRDSRNSIQLKGSYSQCIQANYIAFQNPDYSNKWFFAFIDNVKYISESVTQIDYTIDIFTTWFEYWSAKACFVVREHVEDDTVGLHTVPEDVETGDYVCSDRVSLYSGGNTVYVAVATIYVPEELSFNVFNTRYGGIYSGSPILVFDSPYLSVSNFLRGMDELAKADAIVGIYMIPSELAGNVTFETKSFSAGGHTYTTHVAVPPYTDSETLLSTSSSLTVPATLNGYTPKNNKLKVFPFSYFYVTNNAGADVEFHYEDFVNNTAQFKTIGVLTPSCSIKCIPLNYKKLSDTASSYKSFNSGITGPKYPICSWKSDVYTNWLTENANNFALAGIGSAGSIIGGIGLLATGGGAGIGLGMIAGGIGGIASTVAKIYDHSLTPPQSQGNMNSGDVAFSSGAFDIPAYKMTIKEEYAKIIDDTFTRTGYKINRLKVPNMTHRQNYNYVQIASEENVAYPNNHNNIGIPASALNQINEMFRSGITLWNNHTNFGDYSVSNTIVN